MRRLTIALCAAGIAACATSAPGPDMNSIAERYVKLVLRVGQHLPDLPGRIPVVLRAPEHVGGAQAQYLRVPLADGTLVATPGTPPAELVPSLLAASDVLGTGWFAADAANVKPGSTVAVVGDGAVGRGSSR